MRVQVEENNIRLAVLRGKIVVTKQTTTTTVRDFNLFFPHVKFLMLLPVYRVKVDWAAYLSTYALFSHIVFQVCILLEMSPTSLPCNR